MYKVLRRKSAPNFPTHTLTLWYDVDFDGDNHEWRACVDDVVRRLSAKYHVAPVAVPAFEPNEDFVELTYLLGHDLVKFSCDFLLYSIYIESPSKDMAESLAQYLGEQVGWESA